MQTVLDGQPTGEAVQESGKSRKPEETVLSSNYATNETALPIKMEDKQKSAENTAAMSNDAAIESNPSVNTEPQQGSFDDEDKKTSVGIEKLDCAPMIRPESFEGRASPVPLATSSTDNDTELLFIDPNQVKGSNSVNISQSIDAERTEDITPKSPPPTASLKYPIISPPTILVSDEANESASILSGPDYDNILEDFEVPQTQEIEISSSTEDPGKVESHHPQESASQTQDISAEIKLEEPPRTLPSPQDSFSTTKAVAKFAIPGLTYSFDNALILESTTAVENTQITQNPQESPSQTTDTHIDATPERAIAADSLNPQEVLFTMQSIARDAIAVLHSHSEDSSAMEEPSSQLQPQSPAPLNNDDSNNTAADVDMPDHTSLASPAQTSELPSSISMPLSKSEPGLEEDATVARKTSQNTAMDTDTSPVPTSFMPEVTPATTIDDQVAPPKKRTPLPVMPAEFWAKRKAPRVASSNRVTTAKKRKNKDSVVAWESDSTKPDKKSKIAAPNPDVKGKLAAPYLNHTAGESATDGLDDAADFWNGSKVVKRSRTAPVEVVKPKAKKHLKVTKAIVKKLASDKDKNTARLQKTIGTQTD